MNGPVFSGLDSLAQLPWMIAAIGVGVSCLAFVVGRRFLTPRPAEEPPETPPEDVYMDGGRLERRAAPRRRGNSVEVFLAEAPDREKVHGWVVNRSVGGLCLVVEKPVE